jgi:hypothetical protein
MWDVPVLLKACWTGSGMLVSTPNRIPAKTEGTQLSPIRCFFYWVSNSLDHFIYYTSGKRSQDESWVILILCYTIFRKNLNNTRRWVRGRVASPKGGNNRITLTKAAHVNAWAVLFIQEEVMFIQFAKYFAAPLYFHILDKWR